MSTNTNEVPEPSSSRVNVLDKATTSVDASGGNETKPSAGAKQGEGAKSSDGQTVGECDEKQRERKRRAEMFLKMLQRTGSADSKTEKGKGVGSFPLNTYELLNHLLKECFF